MATMKRKANPDSLQTLKRHYELGCELCQRYAERRNLTRLASEYDCSPATLYKARSFARQFSKDEFNELCELRTHTGGALSWAHVIHCLAIRDKTIRSELMREAAVKGWSPRKLDFQTKQRDLKPRRRVTDDPSNSQPRRRRHSVN